jgi:hypothetical protein
MASRLDRGARGGHLVLPRPLEREHMERARIALLIGDEGHAEAAALADVLLEGTGAHLGEHVGRRAAGPGMRHAVLRFRAL